MDWTKQSEEMVKTWTETQKKMWGSWLETIQQGSSQAEAFEIWRKTIETWENTVESTLKAQDDWVKNWANSIDVSKMEVPKEMKEWAQQAQDMTNKWSKTQKQLWEGWFDLVKQADPAKIVGSWEDEGQDIFKTWQESAQKVMDGQMKWAGMWASEPGKTKAKTAGKK